MPALAFAAAAPAISASTPQTCWTGNMSGAAPLSFSYSNGGDITDFAGAKWRRWDCVITIMNTWSGSTLTDLEYVVPWSWSGPQLANTNGPWVAATWDEATGMWTSNRPESLGDRMYLSTYQSATPYARLEYLPYTQMPFSPMGTTSDGPSNPASTASISTSDHVYVLPFPSTPLTYGQSATVNMSFWVEYSDNNALMQFGFWGNVMGIGCE